MEIRTEEVSRDPKQLNEFLLEQQWAVVCDGSVSELDEGKWVFVVYQEGKEQWHNAGSCGRGYVSTDMEVTALHEALEWIRNEGLSGQQLTVLSDSRDVLHLISSVEPRTNQQQLRSIQSILSSLSTRFRNIHFQWIKGHIGFQPHDQVDRLTGTPQPLKGTQPISISFLKTSASRQMTKEWKSQWSANRRSGLFSLRQSVRMDLKLFQVANV
jgi:ribonuclease HI